MKELKRIQRLLLAQFCAPLLIALCVIILFETDVLLPGLCTGQATQEFVWLSVMELVTICMIPLSLRLFKWNYIQLRLQQPMRAIKTLQVWGSCRLAMLTIPLLLNVLLYYLFVKAAFAYMAIIVFLCLFFIIPTMERCLQETHFFNHND